MEKIVYTISGKTKSGRFASTGMYPTVERAKEAFKSQYPRFNGLATIYKRIVEDKGDGIVVFHFDWRGTENNEEALHKFSNIKEMNNFALGGELCSFQS